MAGLSWNVVECPPLLNGKPVILHGSDVLFTGKEIFVGIRKHATNIEGAIVSYEEHCLRNKLVTIPEIVTFLQKNFFQCLGGVFCDIPVIPIHMHEKSYPLKYYVSIAGPQIVAIGKGKEAQHILRVGYYLTLNKRNLVYGTRGNVYVSNCEHRRRRSRGLTLCQ